MIDDSRTDGHVGRHRTAVVNGPEGVDLDWLSIDWQQAEDDVRRLRQRIFTASQAGDLKRVRSLQKLMLRSRANALLSVRRVTERNAGRKTAGVDGVVVVTAPGKAFLADSVQRHGRSWTPKPVKRGYVRKANGKQRPLGIPTERGIARSASSRVQVRITSWSLILSTRSWASASKCSSSGACQMGSLIAAMAARSGYMMLPATWTDRWHPE